MNNPYKEFIDTKLWKIVEKTLQALLLICISLIFLACNKKIDFQMHNNCLKKEDAINVAVNKMIEIYGESQISEEQPFTASSQENQIWFVEGTFKKQEFGGVAFAEIQGEDCKILKISHGK